MGSEVVSEFKTQAVVGADGSVTVEGLPFPAGEAVEVTVTPAPARPAGVAPLAGSVLHYDDPTGPVAADDARPHSREGLLEWAEQNAEDWGDRIRSDDVEGFTGRRF